MNKGFITLCLLLTATPLCAQEQMPDDIRRAAPHLVRPLSLAGTAVAKRVSASDLSAQYKFLRNMPSAWVEYTPLGVTHQIRGELGLSLPNGGADLTVGDSAPGLLSLIKPALLARGTETLTVTHNKIVGYNRVMGSDERVIKLEQSIRGIPVKSANVALSVDSKSGVISVVTANFLPDRGLPQKPGISASQAIASVMKEISAGGSEAPTPNISPQSPKLAYVFGSSIGKPDLPGGLVWCVEFDDGQELKEALVDTVDGNVVAIRQLSRSLLSRSVYSANTDFDAATVR